MNRLVPAVEIIRTRNAWKLPLRCQAGWRRAIMLLSASFARSFRGGNSALFSQPTRLTRLRQVAIRRLSFNIGKLAKRSGKKRSGPWKSKKTTSLVPGGLLSSKKLSFESDRYVVSYIIAGFRITDLENIRKQVNSYATIAGSIRQILHSICRGFDRCAWRFLDRWNLSDFRPSLIRVTFPDWFSATNLLAVSRYLPVLNIFKPHRKPHRTASLFQTATEPQTARIAERVRVPPYHNFSGRLRRPVTAPQTVPQKKILNCNRTANRCRPSKPHRKLRFAVRCGPKMFNTATCSLPSTGKFTARVIIERRARGSGVSPPGASRA